MLHVTEELKMPSKRVLPDPHRRSQTEIFPQVILMKNKNVYFLTLFTFILMSANLKEKRSSALVEHTCILRTKIISYLKGHELYDLCKYADSFYTAEVQKSFKQYIYTNTWNVFVPSSQRVYPTLWSMTHNNCTLLKKIMKYNYR